MTINKNKEMAMPKSRFKHLSRLASLVICFELCFAPLALAQSNSNGQPNRVENRWKNTADAFGSISGIVMSGINAYKQGQQQASGSSVDQFKAELAPVMRMTPIDPQEIPSVFQSCIVLPAAGTNLTGAYSCREADPARVDAGYATAVKDLAEQNRQDLLNFQTVGHARFSTQGIGCYEKQLDFYNVAMASRLEGLTNFINGLTDRIENLTVPLQNADGSTRNVPIDEFLDLVKTDEALLTGKPERFIKDVKFENFLLGQDDLVCKTILSASDIQNSGKKGLREIEQDIFKKANNSTNGNMTATEMLAKAKDITNEVKTYGRELAKMAKRNDGLELDTNDVTYSSKLSGSISNSLKRVATQFNAKMKQELKSLEEESDVNQAVAGNAQAKAILKGIKDGNTNFDARVNDYERRSKSQCLRESLAKSFGSIESFATSFRDPSVSRRLAKEADNSLANSIMSEIGQKDSDIETMFAKISAQEKTGGNDKKVYVSGRTFKCGGKTYGALPMRASQLLSCFKDTCISSFQNTPNADGFTNQEVVEKLKEYGSKYNALKTQAPNQIKTLLQDEIVNCPQDTTTGSGALSCNGALQASSANFCVRTAVTCASNMNGCLEKSRSVVKDIKAKQDGKVKFLKQTTNVLKNNIKKELADLTKFYETQARMMDDELKIGTAFKMPEEMAFNLNANFAFGGEESQGLNSEFNLEDPKKMLEQAQAKVRKLKTAIETHSKEVGKELESIKKTYIDNYGDQQNYWEDVIADCDDRNRDHNEEKARIEEERLESQAEIDRSCQQLRAFNEYNDCDTVGDLMESVQESAVIASRQAANDPTQPNQQAIQSSTASAISQLGQVRRFCGRSERTGYRPPTPTPEQLARFCDSSPTSESYCHKWKESKELPMNQKCESDDDLEDILLAKVREEMPKTKIEKDTELCVEFDKDEETITGFSDVKETVDGKCEKDYKKYTVEKLTKKKTERAALAGCYIKEMPSTFNTLTGRVVSEFQNKSEVDPTSQIGEQNQVSVSVAQCNAQGDGFTGSKGLMDLFNQAAGAVGRSAASTQEGGARTTIGN